MADNVDEIKNEESRNSRLQIGIGTAIVVAIMIIVAVVIYINFIADKKYNKYEVINSVQRDDDGNTKYIAYDGDSIIKYSRDGITAINEKGEQIWSASYNMKNPLAVTCKDKVAVADIGNQILIIYDGKGKADEVEILKPIQQVAVCEQGIAAVVLEDDDCNYIDICDGDTIYTEIKTRIKEDGYPVSIAYAPDGKKLVTGYVQVSGDSVKSLLTFYNFSEVGKNYDSDIVKAEDMGDNIVADIAFVNDKNVAVFADNKAMVYEMKEIPSLIFETQDFGERIRSVSWDKDYISLVVENESDTNRKLYVYSLNGKTTGTYDSLISYNNIVMSGEDVVLYSDNELQIITKNGNEKLHMEETGDISYILGYNDKDKYYMINPDGVNYIELKRGN